MVAGAVILGAAVCLVYAGAVDAPFVFDDESSVVGNPSITRLWPLIGASEDGGPLNPPDGYPISARPLVNLSLALNYHFGGLDPRGYHVVNIALHLLSALLLVAIVRRTLRLDYFRGRFDRVADPLAWAVALSWAVHPLVTESVVYVTQRTELMFALFYLAALYASLHYWAMRRGTARTAWMAVAALAGILGGLSKEMMATAPVMVLLFERTFIAGSFRRALRESWPLYVGLALGWIPLLVINLDGPRTPLAGFDQGIDASVWWLTQTKVLLMYLKLAFWPWPLVIHYHVPFLYTLGEAWPYLVPTLLLGLASVVLLWRRSAAGFVGAWLFVVLSPTLLVPLAHEVAAERRMYLPLVALVAFVVIAGYELARRIAAHPAHAGAQGSAARRPPWSRRFASWPRRSFWACSALGG